MRAVVGQWYNTPSDQRHQRRLDLKERVVVNRQAREGLSRLFRDKCAFCESSLGASSSGEVERFRPFAEATNLSGEGSPDHYTWLVAEWGNLYLTCAACSRAKRSLFPVQGPRAPILTPWANIHDFEVALLLDPCLDEPDLHLQFLEGGYVQPLSLKGETTIKVLNLNRSGLVQARADTWSLVDSALASDAAGSVVATLLSPDRPHLAAALAASRTFRQRSSAGGPVPVRPSPTVRMAPERRSADEILATDDEAFRLTARPLRRVEITNFRALRDVKLDFEEPSTGGAPWLMLLGENATGKSTILQAIALALAGVEEAQRHTRPSKVISSGAHSGSVKVWFWDQDEAAELYFQRGNRWFTGTPRPSAIVLGYGAMRYAERKPRLFEASPPFSRITPLMAPLARIRYPGRWLVELDAQRFDVAAKVLSVILPDIAQGVMRRGPSAPYFDLPGHQASLTELSAGYQTIVGLCADIMRLLFERWDTLASATAIVLIDEIDAHLHPQWAMRIVSALRQAFPQVQFIASTHDPLTLRGLVDGEVALLRRDETGEILVDQNLPRIEGLRVDELLTSRVFGLNSTLDPEAERLLDLFYELRALPPTPEREAAIQQIRDRIGDREALGRTDSERLMLKVADEFYRRVEADRRQSPPLSDETLSRLREIVAEPVNRGSST